MEKTETDFSDMYSDRTRGTSHKLRQGTFHRHMGKMGKQMSQRQDHVLEPAPRQDVASPTPGICNTSLDKVSGSCGTPMYL